MSPDYYRFVASLASAGHNVTIIFGAVCMALVTYQSIDWYPTKWQKTARIAAHVFAILLLAATVVYSL